MNVIKKILVVEDQDIAAMIVGNILSGLNLIFDIAETGKKALLCAKKTKYDLILMDIGLPDTDGFEVTKEIRKQKNPNQRSPIIALTASEDQAYKENAKKCSLDDFLIKPLTMDKAKEIFRKFSILV